jgi:hypothetical protein
VKALVRVLVQQELVTAFVQDLVLLALVPGLVDEQIEAKFGER